MEPVTQAIIEQAIDIIGTDGIAEEAIETQVAALVSDAMTARRLIDWIPEAFGLVLASHVGKLVLPKTFSARASDGKWLSIGLKEEPIFIAAVQIAQQFYHHGSRSLFQNIAMRSAIANSINNALNSGATIDGAVLSGPALIGIPAEIYPNPPKSFLLKLYVWWLSHTRRRKSP